MTYSRPLGSNKPWADVKAETDARRTEDKAGQKHCGVRAHFENEGLWECGRCGAYKFQGDATWTTPR